MGLIFISHDLNLVASLLRPRPDHVCRPRRRKLPRRDLQCRDSIPIRAACSPPCRARRRRRRTAGADARSRLARLTGGADDRRSTISTSCFGSGERAVHAVRDVSLPRRRRRELRPGRRIRLGQVDGAAGAIAASIRSGPARIERRRRDPGAAPSQGVLHGACRWSSRTPTARCIRARRSTASCASRSPSTASTTRIGGSTARARRRRARRAVPLPLSAPALRRPAPARRHRARPDPRAARPAARRADLGARRLGAGGDPQPARAPAARARASPSCWSATISRWSRICASGWR